MHQNREHSIIGLTNLIDKRDIAKSSKVPHYRKLKKHRKYHSIRLTMSNDCFDVKKASKLDSESRINELRPHDLLKDVGGIGGGMVCVDFGSGTGTFSLPMAQLVGTEGKVYAIDKSNDMLEHI